MIKLLLPLTLLLAACAAQMPGCQYECHFTGATPFQTVADDNLPLALR